MNPEDRYKYSILTIVEAIHGNFYPEEEMEGFYHWLCQRRDDWRDSQKAYDIIVNTLVKLVIAEYEKRTRT
jgi:hypothetical protein